MPPVVIPRYGIRLGEKNSASLISHVSLFLSWSKAPGLMTAYLLWILLTFPTFPIFFAKPYKFPFFLAVSLCSIYFTLPKYLLFSFPVLTSSFFFFHHLCKEARLLACPPLRPHISYSAFIFDWCVLSKIGPRSPGSLKISILGIWFLWWLTS